MLELMHFTDKEKTKIYESMVVLVDTREKDGKNNHILTFFDNNNISYKRKALQYGDYSFMIPADPEIGISKDLYFDRKIVVERKADLDEIAVNLTKERERLKKELALAPKDKVLIIESGSYEDMVTGNYKSDYKPKSFWGSYHSLWHEYDVPIIFMPNRSYTGQFIYGYFTYYLHKFLC